MNAQRLVAVESHFLGLATDVRNDDDSTCGIHVENEVTIHIGYSTLLRVVLQNNRSTNNRFTCFVKHGTSNTLVLCLLRSVENAFSLGFQGTSNACTSNKVVVCCQC